MQPTSALQRDGHGAAEPGEGDGERAVDGEAEGHVPGEDEAGAVGAGADHLRQRAAALLRRRPAAVGAPRHEVEARRERRYQRRRARRRHLARRRRRGQQQRRDRRRHPVTPQHGVRFALGCVANLTRVQVFWREKKRFEAVSCDLDATYIGEGFDFRVVDEDLVRLVARTELMLTHASL